MYFQLHTINSARPLSNSDQNLQGTHYPIGLSLDKFLDLISDVRSFSLSLTCLVTPINLNAGLGVSNLSDGINALDTLNGGSSFYSLNGNTVRQIAPIGKINDDYSLNSTDAGWPTSLSEYPIFVRQGTFGSKFELNLGRTKFLNGLFFPYVTISFSPDIGSSVGDFLTSYVSFGSYGNIPIYMSASLLTDNIVVIGGSIEIKNRFSEIVPSSQILSAGQTINFSGQELSVFSKAFLNEIECPVSAGQTSLSLIIPENAKSGAIRFEQNAPLFNCFYSDRITIS